MFFCKGGEFESNTEILFKMIKRYLCFCLFICVFIRIFLGEPCYIPSESMEPTLQTGDWVWVNKVSYGALLPERFADIPLLNIFTWITPLRKIDEENNWKWGRMVGWEKPQEYDVIVFRSPENRNILLTKRVVRVSEHEGGRFYYVMGDNQENSVDSRFWGEIPDDAVIGKIDWILFSVRKGKRVFKHVE